MPLYIAIPMVAIGVLIQLTNKLSEKYKDSIDKIPYLKTVLFWLSLALIVLGGYHTIDTLIKAQKYEIHASPAEINLEHRRNKNFISWKFTFCCISQ